MSRAHPPSGRALPGIFLNHAGRIMDPVGQSQSPPSPPRDSRPFELLFWLLDLSKAALPRGTVKTSLSPEILAKAFFGGDSPGPLRFLPLPPGPAKLLEKMLDSASSSTKKSSIDVVVVRKENHLEWLFSSKGGGLRFVSPLLRSRHEAIGLEPSDLGTGESPPASPSPPVDKGSPWQSGSLPSLPEEGRSEESVNERGALRSHGSLGAGPVVAWPAYLPGRTIEFSVRWYVPEGEGGEEGRAISFTLDIPWEGPDGNSPKESIRLMGQFLQKGEMTLSGRALPQSFCDHVEARGPLLKQSLRVYPGIDLTLRLTGKGSGGPA